MGSNECAEYWVPDGWQRATEAEYMEATERVIELPADAHVLPARRIGDTQRLQYAEHLDYAFAEGILTDDEHTARLTFVVGHARTQVELDAIVADLPPIPLTPRPVEFVVPGKHLLPTWVLVIFGIMLWSGMFAGVNSTMGAVLFTAAFVLTLTWLGWKVVKK
jgi:hypothetical protein